MAEIKEVYSAAQIADRVETLAREITQACEGRELTVLGVLDDSFVFLADLLRSLKTPARTAFLRYDHQSLGGVQDISFSTRMDLSGRDVVLVEGVLDTGVTQEYLIKHLGAHGAKSVRLCVLVDKPDRRRLDLQPDWRAFETHESYVFGYGLGFQERFRELPFLATFAE
ncbi:MAG TPA: phosphoribosyltransferase family protein [Pyrinomonadaceae bacterium]|jgi:hypoxanthine phosphoribosyltransferase|nr:phosphoribosyltransferase family protein [Pyrinomonadaceae bacterium]